MIAVNKLANGNRYMWCFVVVFGTAGTRYGVAETTIYNMLI